MEALQKTFVCQFLIDKVALDSLSRSEKQFL